MSNASGWELASPLPTVAAFTAQSAFVKQTAQRTFRENSSPQWAGAAPCPYPSVKPVRISLEPPSKYAGAINNLGVVYMQMEKPLEALAAFRYGTEVAPNDETLYLNLARVYVRLGDQAKARDVLLQLLDHKPDSAAAKEALEALRRL